MKKQASSAGLTLVELVVAIVILGILAFVVVLVVGGETKDKKHNSPATHFVTPSQQVNAA